MRSFFASSSSCCILLAIRDLLSLFAAAIVVILGFVAPSSPPHKRQLFWEMDPAVTPINALTERLYYFSCLLSNSLWIVNAEWKAEQLVDNFLNSLEFKLQIHVQYLWFCCGCGIEINPGWIPEYWIVCSKASILTNCVVMELGLDFSAPSVGKAISKVKHQSI